MLSCRSMLRGRSFRACSLLPSSPSPQFKFYLKKIPRNSKSSSSNSGRSRTFFVQRTFPAPQRFHPFAPAVQLSYGTLFRLIPLPFSALHTRTTKTEGRGVSHMVTCHRPVLTHLASNTHTGRSFNIGSYCDDDAALGGNSGSSADAAALAFASSARCRFVGSLESPASVVCAC
jgi:hypothetical protein